MNRATNDNLCDVQAKEISCDKLQGVGPKTLTRLSRLNLNNVQDLLFHLPHRYEDRTKISLARSIKVGEYGVVVGVVVNSEVVRRGRAILYCTLQDASGSLQLCFFNFSKQRLQFKLTPGTRIYCYGEVRWIGNARGMVHPEYKILQPAEEPPLTKSLTPVYPTTEGLFQAVLRKLIFQAINISKGLSLDKQQHSILNELICRYQLSKFESCPDLFEAISFVHQPPAHLEPKLAISRDHPMRQRLIFEELLAMQLGLLKMRQVARDYEALAFGWDKKFYQELLFILPFELTKAQERVLNEIALDLKKSQPMHRLVQGDVGSGKTIIAAIAMAQVVRSGYQAALMAPTELLAEQHFKNIDGWLKQFGIKSVLLTGKIKGKNRAIIEKEIVGGEAQVVIGTHAIFQEKINFNSLALIVIDEQHRFGVHQRLQLKQKGFKDNKHPHQLIMTATPIPRTLTMTVYADLDCSIIDELPKGRGSVKTILVSNKRRDELIAKVRNNCREGRQVYWVCPLIEESEVLECQAAETLAKELTKDLPELKIGLIHGRKSSPEKEKIMSDFVDHRIDLLVATTVIEVGVDVPNASLMIIEDAPRLGLVQIHQLRGRVGRGSVDSFCVLLYQEPLAGQAKERLLLLRDTNDGFEIARRDLAMRGAGEVLGTRQTGILSMKVADLILDQGLIPGVQKVARLLIEKDPNVANLIIDRWLTNKEQYGGVI